MAVNLKIFLAVKIIYPKKVLCKLHSLRCKPYSIVLLLVIYLFHKCCHKKVAHIIEVRLHPGHAGHHQRHDSRVQEYRIRFINNHIVKVTQKTLIFVLDQIIKEIVKAQHSVCHIYDVCLIKFLFLLICHFLLLIGPGIGAGNPHKVVDLAHLLPITGSKIFIGGHKYAAFPGEGIKVERHCGRQGLSLACIHLSQITLMHGNTC